MNVRELPDLMLTVEEAATSLRLSKSYVKKLIAAGKMPSVKVGRCRRVRLRDLGAYVSNLDTTGPPATDPPHIADPA